MHLKMEKTEKYGNLKHEEHEKETVKFRLVCKQVYWVEVNQSRRLTGARHLVSNNGKGDLGES